MKHFINEFQEITISLFLFLDNVINVNIYVNILDVEIVPKINIV